MNCLSFLFSFFFCTVKEKFFDKLIDLEVLSDSIKEIDFSSTEGFLMDF
ncbi:unnamed protein product [Camellia sinensis]